MKKINLAWLPYLGAIVQAGLFAMAGDRYFGAWGWLVGCGVGAVVNLSLAVASSKISDIARKRQPLARLALFGMFLLSPATITLSLYAPTSVFTSIAWAACPDVSIILAGAIAGQGLIAVSEPDAKGATHRAKSPKKVRRSATESAKSATDSIALRPNYPRKCAHCDAQIQSPNAVGAHMKKHHPELCKPSKSLAEALFTPVEKKS